MIERLQWPVAQAVTRAGIGAVKKNLRVGGCVCYDAIVNEGSLLS